MRTVLFPGQGFQRPAMLTKKAIAPYISLLTLPGIDLPNLLTDPCAELDKTEVAQPVLVAAGYIAYKNLKIKPRFGIGHSIGEYTALACADYISLPECLNLVYIRGKLMAGCSSRLQGMSMVLNADLEALKIVCAKHKVSIASYNTKTRVVISGLKTNIDAVITELNLKSIALKVSGAFHSQYMRPAADELKQYIDTANWKKPIYPVISNLTAKPYSSTEEVKTNLVASMTRPVQLYESVQFAEHYGKIVDIGNELKHLNT